MNSQCCFGLILAFLTTLAARGDEIAVNDSEGALGATRSPVTVTVTLSQSERRAAVEGRLQLRELRSAAASVEAVVPVQLFATVETSSATSICWLMPSGPRGKRIFMIEEAHQATHPRVTAKQNAATGQFDLADDGKLVLRYNYAAIEPGEILKQVAPANRIYARARSDYIHPLYGLDGEELTRDWSIDHPHHRGIYWAWPEVDWRGRRGDLHALQHVFAKPIGKCSAVSGPVFAQLEAENVWQWENGESLVQERAVIRAYRATEDGRFVDLEFQFAAVHDTVLLARRETDKYGGLNLRLASVKDQEIIFHTDQTNVAPRLAWAELDGKFGNAQSPSGLVVLQHSGNPDYPGYWVKFPELNWFQPTFPASGTRYPLKPGEPLVLRYRLWLHRDSRASEESCAAHGRAYHAPLAPNYLPVR